MALPPISSRRRCGPCRWARPTASARWRRSKRAVRRTAEAALSCDLARRHRHGDAAARLVLAAPRDAIHAAVPLMTAVLAFLLFVGVGAIAVVHALWGLGSTWPEANEEALARGVVGDGRKRDAAAVAVLRRGRRAGAGRAVALVVLGRELGAGVLTGTFTIAGTFVGPRLGGLQSALAKPFQRRAVCQARQAVLFALQPVARRAAISRCWPEKWNDECAWSPAGRCRRSGRLGQDGAGRASVQDDARHLRHRRRHQRHLHQGRCRVPDARRRAGAGPDRRRRDRRLSAYGDPRGRLDQPRRRLGHRAQVAGPRDRLRRIRAATISPPPSRPSWPTSPST